MPKEKKKREYNIPREKGRTIKVRITNKQRKEEKGEKEHKENQEEREKL